MDMMYGWKLFTKNIPYNTECFCHLNYYYFVMSNLYALFELGLILNVNFADSSYALLNFLMSICAQYMPSNRKSYVEFQGKKPL